MTPQSLDPHENPWMRGDVCTKGFEKVGFVVSYTSGYLEILWPNGIERVPSDEVDDIRRMAHWDSVPPGGQKTNLETLESLEALEILSNALSNALTDRAFKNEHEKAEVDNLMAIVIIALFMAACRVTPKNGRAKALYPLPLAVNDAVLVCPLVKERAA